MPTDDEMCQPLCFSLWDLETVAAVWWLGHILIECTDAWVTLET